MQLDSDTHLIQFHNETCLCAIEKPRDARQLEKSGKVWQNQILLFESFGCSNKNLSLPNTSKTLDNVEMDAYWQRYKVMKKN